MARLRLAKTRTKTKKELQQEQDARVFSQLVANWPATAQQIADASGDEQEDIFCTEGQARSAFNRLHRMGLVEQSDDPVKVGRRIQQGWEPTYLGIAIANALIKVFTEDE